MSLYLIGLQFTSCKKNDPPDFPTPPIDPDDTTTIECLYDILNIQYPRLTRPCYNTNNKDEFVYLSDNYLHKFNMVTGEDVLLTDVKPIDKPHWGANGVILIGNFSIRSIREDGSDLQQLSPESSDIMSYRYPYWSPDAQFYSYLQLGHNAKSGESRIIVARTTDNTVDSICVSNDNDCVLSSAIWKSDNQLLLAYADPTSNLVFSQYDISTGVLESIHSVNDGSTYLIDYCFSSDVESIIYTLNQQGIFSYSIETGIEKLIKPSAQNENYSDITVSPNGSQILAIKEVRSKDQNDTCITLIENIIVRMNADGSNEEEILVE